MRTQTNRIDEIQWGIDDFFCGLSIEDGDHQSNQSSDNDGITVSFKIYQAIFGIRMNPYDLTDNP